MPYAKAQTECFEEPNQPENQQLVFIGSAMEVYLLIQSQRQSNFQMPSQMSKPHLPCSYRPAETGGHTTQGGLKTGKKHNRKSSRHGATGGNTSSNG